MNRRENICCVTPRDEHRAPSRDFLGPFYPQQRRTEQALGRQVPPAPPSTTLLAAPQRPCWRGPSLQHAQASLRCRTPVPPLASIQGSSPPRPFHNLSTLSPASCSPGLPAPLSHTAFLLTCPVLLCPPATLHVPMGMPAEAPLPSRVRGGLGKGRDVGLHGALECTRSPCRPSLTQRGP